MFSLNFNMDPKVKRALERNHPGHILVVQQGEEIMSAGMTAITVLEYVQSIACRLREELNSTKTLDSNLINSGK